MRRMLGLLARMGAVALALAAVSQAVMTVIVIASRVAGFAMAERGWCGTVQVPSSLLLERLQAYFLGSVSDWLSLLSYAMGALLLANLANRLHAVRVPASTTSLRRQSD